MHSPIASAAAIACLLSFASVASAQSTGPYVHAGAGLSLAPAGPDDAPYLAPGLGGTSPSAILGGGWRLSTQVALGAEVSTAWIGGKQQARIGFGSYADLDRDHRLTFVTGVASFRAPRNLRVVGGVGALIISTQTESIQYLYTGSVRESFEVRGPFHSESRLVAGALVAGADMEIPIRSHLNLLPAFRIYYSNRGQDPSQRLGLSNVFYRTMVLVEVSR